MALFEREQREEQTTAAAADYQHGHSCFYIGSSLKQLKEVIGDIKPDTDIHFATGGSWSLNNLVEYILRQIGPAKMYFSTYSITEDTLRNIHALMNEGLITGIHALLDYRIEKRKAASFQFSKNIITEYALTKCHAKVTVLMNDNWKVCIVGSANMTHNSKLEAGVISTQAAAAEFHKQWIMDKING
jgi:hypothetical protein